MHGSICYPWLLPTAYSDSSTLASKSRKPCHLQGFRFKRMKGFEPSTFAMARRRSSQLSYIRKVPPFYRRRGARCMRL